MKTVHSFDVFDTCLTRKMAVPTGVFFQTGRKTFSKLGISDNSSLLEDFVAARIEAEHAARRVSKKEDITLEDIWRILAKSMGWQVDAALMNCELEAEEESLMPIASIRSQVKTVRSQGNKIIFVSDMYLPAAFIEGQLKKHGFVEPGDAVYVSSEVGKTKSSGNLFKHVLEKENMPAENLFHHGDNHHSDYEVSRKLGINAVPCEPARMSPTESAVLQIDGDIEKTAKIAGTMRAFRLGAASEETDPIFELAAEFVGPFIFALATWTLQRAQKDGVKRLYFLSRDCQLLCKVAAKLAPQFGNIECKYLYVSRQALFLPSSDSISPEGMPWMRREFEEPILKKLLAKIDLKYENVESLLGDMAGSQRDDYRLKSEEDWSRFWSALNSEPTRTHVNNLIISRRNLARKYFESAGLLDDVPWAIVDLGWTLACQRALWNLLKKWGWEQTMRGYYFGLMKQRVGPEAAGLSEALFYRPAYDFPRDTRVNAVFARVTLLEHIIGCADHPTVHHHERLANGDMGAVYASSVNESTLKFCDRLHKCTLDFADQSLALAEDFKDPVLCQNTIASLVINFFTHPSAKPASALLGISATEDQNGLDPLPIVKPLDWGKTLMPLLNKPDPFAQNKSCFWLEGSLAITPKKVRKFLNLTQRAGNRLARLRN